MCVDDDSGITIRARGLREPVRKRAWPSAACVGLSRPSHPASTGRASGPGDAVRKNRERNEDENENLRTRGRVTTSFGVRLNPNGLSLKDMFTVLYMYMYMICNNNYMICLQRMYDHAVQRLRARFFMRDPRPGGGGGFSFSSCRSSSAWPSGSVRGRPWKRCCWWSCSTGTTTRRTPRRCSGGCRRRRSRRAPPGRSPWSCPSRSATAAARGERKIKKQKTNVNVGENGARKKGT